MPFNTTDLIRVLNILNLGRPTVLLTNTVLDPKQRSSTLALGYSKPLILFMVLKSQSSVLSSRTEALRKLKQKMKKCRVCVRQIVRSYFFYWSVIVCVFLNTLVIALEHHGQPQFLTDFQGLYIQ